MHSEIHPRDFSIQKILLIDDELTICENMRAYLEDEGYQVELAHNGRDGLQQLESWHPDLVVVDLHMPIMSGHDFLARAHQQAPFTPLLVLSGVGDIGEAMATIQEGSWDFIAKPLQDMNLLRHKIGQLEERAALKLQNHLYQDHLEQLVEQKTADLQQLNLQIIKTQRDIVAKLGDVIETRSNETGNHVKRVAKISELLALACGLSKEEAERIRMASPLHDVGKVGIPDAILNKPGKLTDEEFEQMKTHTTIGHNMLKDSDQPIIQTGAIIALEHHERWDGSGYPRGLQGDQIHLYGRITCLADVYDALLQKRAYKRSWSQQETLDYIRDCSGSFFDPKLVELFFENLDQIREIEQDT